MNEEGRTQAPRPQPLLRPVLLAAIVLILAGVVEGLIALVEAIT